MFKHTVHGISITAILDKRRMSSQGEHQVRILVIYKRAKKYFTTGKSCTTDEWARMPKAKSSKLIEMREEIQLSFEIVKKRVVELLREDKFSLVNLAKNMHGDSGKSLNALLEDKITACRNEKRIGTMRSYECTLSNLHKFRKDNIPVEIVTVAWLKDFEKFLAESRTITTIAINMRNIRTVMNVARKEGYIKETQYPFGEGKYVIRTEEGRKKALSFEQIKKIKEFTCEDHELMMYRDLWLFIYYCNGINIADPINLKFCNIVDGEITFVRHKTKNTAKTIKHVRAVVLDEMQIIIDRWGNEPFPENYIFNLIEHTEDAELEMSRKSWFTKKLNQKMKLIGAMVGVPGVTSYVARHSYATVLKRNHVNIAFISESLGNTSLATTQIYLDSFGKEERMKNARLLKIADAMNQG